MNLLIVDTETTGTDHTKDQVIEVAAILYSVECRAVIQSVATTIECDKNPAQHINGIDPEITRWAATDQALEVIYSMAKWSDYATAYNADFDKAWFGKAPLRHLLNHDGDCLPWFDVMDMPFPNAKQGCSLVELAVNQGVPVVTAHRALPDCERIAAIFSRQSNLEELIEIAARPRMVVKALVGYHDRKLADDAGFKYNRLIPKAWAKKMTQEEIDDFICFDIEVVA